MPLPQFTSSHFPIQSLQLSQKFFEHFNSLPSNSLPHPTVLPQPPSHPTPIHRRSDLLLRTKGGGLAVNTLEGCERKGSAALLVVDATAALLALASTAALLVVLSTSPNLSRKMKGMR